MTEYDELLHNYATHAAQALPPLIRDAAASLGIDQDHGKVESLGLAMAKAYMAGADAGQSEIMAQAAEQGFNIRVDQQRAPE